MKPRNEFFKYFIYLILFFLSSTLFGREADSVYIKSEEELVLRMDSLIEVYNLRIHDIEQAFTDTVNTIYQQELTSFYDRILNGKDAWYNTYDSALAIFSLVITILFGLTVGSWYKRRAEIEKSVVLENQIRKWHEEVTANTNSCLLAKKEVEREVKVFDDSLTSKQKTIEIQAGSWINAIKAVKNDVESKLNNGYQELETWMSEKQLKIEHSLRENRGEIDTLLNKIANDQESYKQETSLAYQYLIEDILDSVRWITEDLLQISKKIDEDSLESKKEFYELHQKNIIEHRWIIQLYKYDTDVSRLTKPVHGLLGRGSVRCMNHLQYLLQKIERKITSSNVEAERNELYKFQKLVKRALSEIEVRDKEKTTF